jgi:uncharacterized protein (TIGR02598 family)
MDHRPISRKSAFTLVEVTIAIGLAAFGILSMLGLMGSLLNANREAGEETVLAAMVKKVSGELRPRPFDAPATGADNSLAALIPSGTNFYFGRDGLLTPTPAEALYACQITLRPDASLTTATTAVENRYDAELEFSWPYPHKKYTKTFQISLARYAN